MVKFLSKCPQYIQLAFTLFRTLVNFHKSEFLQLHIEVNYDKTAPQHWRVWSSMKTPQK